MRVDLSPAGRREASASTSPLRGEVRRRDAVLLVHLPAPVPADDRAGVCGGAAAFAARRDHGAGGGVADFLRRVEARLSAGAARLDRLQFLARGGDGSWE